MDTIDIFILRIFGRGYEEESFDTELQEVPEEIYYQITEIKQELPFQDPLEPFHNAFQD